MPQRGEQMGLTDSVSSIKVDTRTTLGRSRSKETEASALGSAESSGKSFKCRYSGGLTWLRGVGPVGRKPYCVEARRGHEIGQQSIDRHDRLAVQKSLRHPSTLRRQREIRVRWKDRRVRALWPIPSDELDDDALDAYYAWPPNRWVRSNMVASVDGAAQSPLGGTSTLSSTADRRIIGVVRALADAVIVGAGTARSEGYRALRPRERYASQRHANQQASAPTLVIVSNSLDFADQRQLFEPGEVRTIVATTRSVLSSAKHNILDSADVIECGETELDLAHLLDDLAGRGLTRVVVEGGPLLLGTFVGQRVLDDMAVTIAPTVVGGAYADGAPSRIVGGDIVLPESQHVHLAHLLTEADSLFARYEVVHP